MDFTELQAQVLAEHPEAAEGADDWTIVTALRAFATEHVDYVINVDSPRYIEQGGLHHMQTLVEIEVDGLPVLTLHDPSTNLSYTDASGAPIDYFDLLGALAARDASGIGVLEDHAASDNLVGDAETTDIDAYATGSWTIDPSVYTVTEDAAGWVVRSPRTLARFEEVIGRWYGPFLQSRGLPEEAVWLELFPHDIYGDGGEDLLAEAERIVRRSAHIGFEASEGFVIGDEGGTVNQRYDDAGYAIQTWYYGAITIAAVDAGQALRVSWLDGIGGDPEGIFEFQEGTLGEVSVHLWSSDGGDVRVALTNTGYELIHEETLASGSVFYWSDPEAQIWRVTVESEDGDVFVDDFAYGGAAEEPAAEETDETGETGGGPSTEETGGDTDGDTDTDEAVAETDTDEAVVGTETDGGCGCASTPTSPVGWLLGALAACIGWRPGGPAKGPG